MRVPLTDIARRSAVAGRTLAHIRRDALAVQALQPAHRHAPVARPAVAVAAVLHRALLGQQVRLVDGAKLDLVLGAARRERQAPALVALLVGDLLGGGHLDGVTARRNEMRFVVVACAIDKSGPAATYSSSFLHTFGPSSSPASASRAISLCSPLAAGVASACRTAASNTRATRAALLHSSRLRAIGRRRRLAGDADDGKAAMMIGAVCCGFGD